MKKYRVLRGILCVLLCCCVIVQPMLQVQSQAFVGILAGGGLLVAGLILAMGVQVQDEPALVHLVRGVLMYLSAEIKSELDLVALQVEGTKAKVAVRAEVYHTVKAAVKKIVLPTDTAISGYGLTTAQGVPYVPTLMSFVSPDRAPLPSDLQAFVNANAATFTWDKGMTLPIGANVADWGKSEYGKVKLEVWKNGSRDNQVLYDPFEDETLKNMNLETINAMYRVPRFLGLFQTAPSAAGYGYDAYLYGVIGYQLSYSSAFVSFPIRLGGVYGNLTPGVGRWDLAKVNVWPIPQVDGYDDYKVPKVPVTTFPEYYPDVGNLTPTVPETGKIEVVIPGTISGILAGSPADVEIKTDVTNPPIDPPVDPPLPPVVPPIEQIKGFYVDVSVLKRKFPFSIPWDMARVVDSFLAPPQAPQFEISIPLPMIDFTFEVLIDLSKFDTVVMIIRFFLSAEFLYGLIIFTKKILG